MWHCLFALSFFLRTHPLLSLNKGRSSRCRCPGLHQCSLTFPACALRFGERVMGSICLLCTFCELAAVAARCDQRCIGNPFTSARPGRSTALHNRVKQRGSGAKSTRIHLMWWLTAVKERKRDSRGKTLCCSLISGVRLGFVAIASMLSRAVVISVN